VPVQNDGVVFVAAAAEAGADALPAGLRVDDLHLTARLAQVVLEHRGERRFAVVDVDARHLDEL